MPLLFNLEKLGKPIAGLRSGASQEVLILIGLCICLLVFSGCRENLTPCPDFPSSSSLTDAPVGFPPIPFPAENAYTQARWELGKRLFYDPVLSIDSSVSCGSCHKIALGFADGVAFSPGVEDRPGVRNAPGLANIAYHPYYLREGGLPTLEMQVLVPIQEENEFAHNIVDISEELMLDSTYVAQSQAAYGRDPDPYVITRAISTFERTLVSGNSAFDKWNYQGCESALSEEEQRGRALFFSEKTNCAKCHGDFNFTNYAFENNGLYEEYPDIGRMRQTSDSADLARFKVPSLRNVAVSAPYMHDGSIVSLEAVVDHYNAGGVEHVHKSPLVRPLGLSEQEKKDLVRFLYALTDYEFLGSVRFGE